MPGLPAPGRLSRRPHEGRRPGVHAERGAEHQNRVAGPNVCQRRQARSIRSAVAGQDAVAGHAEIACQGRDEGKGNPGPDSDRGERTPALAPRRTAHKG